MKSLTTYLILTLLLLFAAPSFAAEEIEVAGLVKLLPDSVEQFLPDDGKPREYLLADPAAERLFILTGKLAPKLDELVSHRVKIRGRIVEREMDAWRETRYPLLEVREYRPLLDLYVRPATREVRMGRTLSVKLVLQNNTGKKKKFHFPTGRTHDLVILDLAGTELYRFSRSNVVLTEKGRVTLQPGNTTEFLVDVPVDSRLFKPGETYRIKGFVYIEKEEAIVAASSFRVKWYDEG